MLHCVMMKTSVICMAALLLQPSIGNHRSVAAAGLRQNEGV
jgi:hypothetical protein